MEWRIFPLDVLFFRGTEPMNAGESAPGRGQFPPSPEVMQGFVRTALLSALSVSVQEYAAAVWAAGARSEAVQEALTLLGTPGDETGGAGDLGRLDLRGPYLIRQRDAGVERWYPAPLDLRQREVGSVWRPTDPGDPVETDRGTIALLPERREGEREATTGMWISQEGLAAYLRGESLRAAQVARSEDFFAEERRVGIGRDRASHATEEGMLYAPAFTRLKDYDPDTRTAVGSVGIGLRVHGVPHAVQESCAGVHRLGGEGRLVSLEVHEEPAPPETVAGDGRYRLVLLTPARWEGRWLPPGFTQDEEGWRGVFGGQTATVVSAAMGKPVRIGGWDIVRARPKPAVACVPAGSVYFVQARVGGGLAGLHDQVIGSRGSAGFGHVALGRWQ